MNLGHIKKVILRQEILKICFVLLALGLGVYLEWLWRDILAFGLLIFIIINPISPKWLAVPALVLLILAPVLIALKQSDIAEEVVIGVYYFLVMSIMMGIYEIWKEKAV